MFSKKYSWPGSIAVVSKLLFRTYCIVTPLEVVEKLDLTLKNTVPLLNDM